MPLVPSRPSRFDPPAQAIRDTLIQQSLPSLAVAAAQHGELLWEEGFGWADREAMIPATAHSMYSLASISKPVTATALMVLQERGVVDLDRPINEYLGDAPVHARVGDAADATVRRIASHTAGLALHYHFFYEDEPYRRPPMEETIRRYGNLVTVPGERYRYSNLGYGILDHVISRLSGQSYADFLREEVFLPLGMTHSSLGIGPGLEAFEAKRYGEDDLAYPRYDFDHPGGSAVYASAHDLVRFGMFHLSAHLPDQRQILSDASIQSMQQPVVGENDEYGLGWGITADEFGYRTVHHTGGMGGVGTVLYLLPSEGIAIAVLCNSSKNTAKALGRTLGDIFSVLLPPFGERWMERRTQRESGAAEAELKPPFQPPSALLGEWRGMVHTYSEQRPFTLLFKESGDVHARLGDDLTMLVNDVSLQDGWLTGVMAGDIGTPDASRRQHNLHLDLRLRGEVVNGALVAITSDHQDGGAPGKHVGDALASWVELHR